MFSPPRKTKLLKKQKCINLLNSALLSIVLVLESWSNLRKFIPEKKKAKKVQISAIYLFN